MNIYELLESNKIENSENIIRFLCAKSYNDYKIIDENNTQVIINENQKVIIPNELMYCFINIAVPYNNVLYECVELFLNENNIILDEDIHLTNPNIFGTLLVSTENNDLFKEWYKYKNYLLNENCMYINGDDRINILATYLKLNESFNENKFLELEIPNYFLDEVIIGSVNGLYSLIEALIGTFSSKDEALKAAKGNLISKVPWWKKIGLIGSTFNQHTDVIQNNKISNNHDKEIIDYSVKTKNGKLINLGQSYHIKNKGGKWILSNISNPNNERNYDKSSSLKELSKDALNSGKNVFNSGKEFFKRKFNGNGTTQYLGKVSNREDAQKLAEKRLGGLFGGLNSKVNLQTGRSTINGKEIKTLPNKDGGYNVFATRKNESSKPGYKSAVKTTTTDIFGRKKR